MPVQGLLEAPTANLGLLLLQMTVASDAEVSGTCPWRVTHDSLRFLYKEGVWKVYQQRPRDSGVSYKGGEELLVGK